MSALGDLRGELASALASTDALVYTFLPEVLNAPALAILPGSPYVTTEGQPFGHHAANFTVVVVADVSTNEVVTAALDDLIGQAVVALHAAGLSATEAGEPYAFQSNTALHLASDLAVSVPFTFH